MQKQNTPLIDADWLLGPMPPSRSSLPLRMRQRVVAVFTVCSVCLFLILVIPSASRWWVRDQLLQQFYSATTSSEQELAILSLAEMLPDSSHQLVEALGCVNPKASQVAYEALQAYTHILLIEKNDDRRSSGLAHVLDIIGQSIAKLSKDRKQPGIALARQLEAELQQTPFKGSRVLTTTCQQILRSESESGSLQTSSAGTQLASTTNAGSPVAIDRPVRASLSDSAVIHPSLLQSQNATVVSIPPAEVVRSAPLPDIAQDRLAASNDSPNPQETSTQTRPDSATITPVFKSPRSQLSGSVRIETASLLSTPAMEQNDLFSEETPGVASPEATLSGSQTIPDPEPDATTESAAEEVVGIDRQKTEDLIALLGSVRAKVASAALYELERRGMTATQLEIAVDLARGNSEARLGALERLIHQEEFDPTPWLGWIAADRDRAVRYRAVSVLGSLNSNSSRTKLRLLLARERDEEITRHIQQILLSGTNTSTARSSSQRTTRP
ncbi:MAG: hypothetical protein NTW52_09885 [Planctomycetota bacterium]|nr:hypothetical protein [Planctomycetota bacterium]